MAGTNIPIIVQGNSFNLAIPLQIYVIQDNEMVLQDYTPLPTDDVRIQLKGCRRNYTYTPTIEGNVAKVYLTGNELADNYSIVVSIVKANGERLRSFRTDQFFIVESSDDLTQADIIAGLEDNVIYLQPQYFIAGEDGRGIVSVAKTSTSGLVDTYTITYTDNTTSTFQVTNGALQPVIVDIEGDVTNAPDEEDLTSENNGNHDVLKFKDKAYMPTIASGLGRQYLRKNFVNGVNKLTQAMIADANTIYHIQYDYDLDGATVTMPAGATLKFEGGSLRNGTLALDNTLLLGCDYLCFKGLTLSGTIQNTELNVDCVYTNDIGVAVNSLFNVVDNVVLSKKKYTQTTTILVDKNNKKLFGVGYEKAVKADGYQQASTEITCATDINAVYITNDNCELHDIRFLALTDRTNTHAGILSLGAVKGLIDNCETSFFATGIHLQGGFNFTLQRNFITNCVFGIACTGGSDQINGLYATNNHVKFVYGALYLHNSNNLTFNHTTIEVCHPDYNDRTIIYYRFNYPLSSPLIIYLSVNATFRDTYIEGANSVMYVDSSSRCSLVDNMYYNSHIGETYVKSFTGNFWGSARNIAIRGVYFAKRVNQEYSLYTSSNGVIECGNNVSVDMCVLSFIRISGENVSIGRNNYETTRFGGVVFVDRSKSYATISSWGLPYFGTTANRPSFQDMPSGFPYFDKDLGKYICWSGTAWINLDGSALV